MVGQDVMNNLLTLGGMLGLGSWAVWERFQKAKVQKASNDANISLSSSTEQMFTLMTARLTAIENDYSRLRDELVEERKHSRMLDIRVQQYQIHVMRLEAMMRNNELEPPELVIEPAHG